MPVPEPFGLRERPDRLDEDPVSPGSLVSTAAPEEIGTTADNLRRGALSERMILDRTIVVFVRSVGLLGTAAELAKVPESTAIDVCLAAAVSELVFNVIG